MSGLNTNNKWYSFVVLAAIGLVGALGQAAFLHNLLVHSYPYKMMSTPPWSFYSAIGETGYYVAVVAAIIGIIASLKLKQSFVATLPVTLCPLAYYFVFIAAHLFSGISSADLADTGNFGRTTGYSNIYEFTVTSVVLIVSGILIAVLITISLFKAEAIWTRRAETRV